MPSPNPPLRHQHTAAFLAFASKHITFLFIDTLFSYLILRSHTPTTMTYGQWNNDSSDSSDGEPVNSTGIQRATTRMDNRLKCML